MALVVKNQPTNADPGSIPGWASSPGGGPGNPLRGACLDTPWTEEPGGLQSMGSQRVGHDWSDLLCTPPDGWWCPFLRWWVLWEVCMENKGSHFWHIYFKYQMPNRRWNISLDLVIFWLTFHFNFCFYYAHIHIYTIYNLCKCKNVIRIHTFTYCGFSFPSSF